MGNKSLIPGKIYRSLISLGGYIDSNREHWVPINIGETHVFLREDVIYPYNTPDMEIRIYMLHGKNVMAYTNTVGHYSTWFELVE